MIKKKIIDKNKGILFFVTGLSGSGKSTISKNIKMKIEDLYGPTIIFSGQKIRKIYKFHGYSMKARIEQGKRNINLIKLILDQKINVIYDNIGLSRVFRKFIRKNIKNYIEIFIKTNVKNIIRLNKKKKVYKKNSKNIVGLDIPAEFPTRPDIIIKNDLKRKFDDIRDELLLKVRNTIIK